MPEKRAPFPIMGMTALEKRALAQLNETLQAGLRAAGTPRRIERYRLEPAPMGPSRPGIDLDRALRLADALEDTAIADELGARK